MTGVILAAHVASRGRDRCRTRAEWTIARLASERRSDHMSIRRRLEFGANADPTITDPDLAAGIASAADRGGLDFVAMQDHPYNRGFFDTWTQLATLVPQTERVRFFPDVACLPLRPPAMLAKAAATLDVLSGGRVELGLGAGAFWDPIYAIGGPRRSPGEAVAALEEAIRVVRMIWSGDRNLRFAGEHYHLAGAQSGPVPAHPIGIWLGALGPKMLALTGRTADGVVWSSSYVTPDRLASLHALIDAAAHEAGRDPASIRRVYNVMGLIQSSAGDEPLVGPPEQWIETLSTYATVGRIDTFIYWPLADHQRQVERFAAEIVPAIRDRAARETGSGDAHPE
jgi:alkanesulfonate monooxygenase SsuD/methylene tetrahydromethanopterin reductase-like flavin-dependent oxidoreductase (luciferase family)